MTTTNGTKRKKQQAPEAKKPVRLIEFTTDPADGEEVPEPVFFSIDGEMFECAVELPSGAINDIENYIPPEGATKAEEARLVVRMYHDFIVSVLVDEEIERFETRLRAKRKVVSNDLVRNIFNALLQEYAGNPLPEPDDSTTGEEPTASSSSETADAEASAGATSG